MLYGLYISSVNDNKLFYVFIPVFFLMYILLSNIGNINFRKIILIVSIFLVISIMLIIKIPFFSKAIKSMYMHIYNAVMNIGAYEGSGERISIVLYFIININKLCGIGFGNGRWTEPYLLGFRHFGISDIGSILCLGGFIFLLLLLLWFFYFFMSVTKDIKASFLLIIFTIFMMISTQIVFTLSGFILFLFFVLTLCWSKNRE